MRAAVQAQDAEHAALEKQHEVVSDLLSKNRACCTCMHAYSSYTGAMASSRSILTSTASLLVWRSANSTNSVCARETPLTHGAHIAGLQAHSGEPQPPPPPQREEPPRSLRGAAAVATWGACRRCCVGAFRCYCACCCWFVYWFNPRWAARRGKGAAVASTTSSRTICRWVMRQLCSSASILTAHRATSHVCMSMHPHLKFCCSSALRPQQLLPHRLLRPASQHAGSCVMQAGEAPALLRRSRPTAYLNGTRILEGLVYRRLP